MQTGLPFPDYGVVVIVSIPATFVVGWQRDEVAVESTHVDGNQADVEFHEVRLIPGVFVAAHDPWCLVALQTR